MNATTILNAVSIGSIIAGCIITGLAIIVVLAEAFTKQSKCKHSDKYFDGDTNSIICEDCGKVLKHFTSREMESMTLDEFSHC